MNNLLTMLGFSMNIKNFFSSSQSEQILLDPLTTIFRLSIIGFKNDGIKISIKDNQIQHQNKTPIQGIVRWAQGDSKEILGNLHKPICLYLNHYQSLPFSKSLNSYTILGLKKLKNTYKKYNLIEHSIQHYIKMIENNSTENELNDQELKYFELYDIWTKSEIILSFTLLEEFSRSKQEATIKALNVILDGKDKLLRKIIIQ